MYYTDFEETQLLRGIEFPLWWSAAQLQPGYTIDNGLVATGTFDNVKGVMRNDINQRDSEIIAFGWNCNSTCTTSGCWKQISAIPQ